MRHHDHHLPGAASAIMTHWREVTFEISLIVAAYFAYFLVRGATEGTPEQAFDNADRIVRLQEVLGIAWEETMQGWITGSQALITLSNWVYIYGHWPTIAVIAAWLLVRHPDRYRLARNAFLISGGIGLLIFASFPVAPPRFTDPAALDTVTEYSRSYRVFQPPALTNQYAAMPSLHFGWNLIMGVLVVMTARPLAVRIFGAVLPVLMFLAVIVTANHFILDAVVGGLLAMAALWLAYRIQGRSGGGGFRRVTSLARLKRGRSAAPAAST